MATRFSIDSRVRVNSPQANDGRVEKLDGYKSIDSLAAYVLVSRMSRERSVTAEVGRAVAPYGREGLSIRLI